MTRKLKRNAISVRKSKTHGFGVFADKTIRKGAIIEECYCLYTHGGDEGLEDYYFDAKAKKKGAEEYIIPTGFGVIYNHSDDENTDYNFNKRDKVMTIVADRTIYKDEEIFVSYGEDWFSERDMVKK